MPGIINTGTHPKALWPGVKAWWGQVYDEHQEEFPMLFDQDTSTRNYEEDVQVTGFGLAPVKPQGQAVSYDSEVQGIISRYTHVAYALGYVVTKEELDDNLYEQISRRRSKALAMSMRQTKENVGAAVYNNAFTAGAFAGADGVALLSASHPNVSGGTYSNLLAVAANLSEAAIEDMTIQIMGATSDRGLLISLMPTHLIVARQNFYTANRIIKSVFQTGTGNNDVNVVAALNVFPKGVHMNHYLTTPNAWFIRTNCPEGMKMYQRTAISFDQDNDFDTMNAKAKSYERYSFGWTDPRALFGTVGT